MIGKEECPECGNTVEKPFKTWIIKNPRTQVDIEIGLYACSECGKKFRRGHQVN